MKILLIYPTITIYGQDKSGVSPIPPLGIAYIAGYMEKLGHEVRIIDCVAEGIDTQIKIKNGVRTGLTAKQIQKRIKEFDPSVVGISAMFSAYAEDAYEIAKITKKVNKRITVVFGGAHANALTEQVLSHKEVDLVVLGEGELTFAEVVSKVEKNRSYKGVRGIACLKNNKVFRTEPRELITDLDALPFPARHLLPMEVYLTKHKNPYVYYDRHTFMITSRGCPMNCIYCSIHSIWHHHWRARKPESIIKEIDYLKREYNVKEIHFVDDNLTANKSRANALFDLIIKRKLNIKWTGPNGVAIWTLDKPLLRKMKESGCYRLTFGIESGSKVTQKFIRKNLDLSLAKRMITYANKIGIWTLSTFIIGFPFQDEKQINESIKYAVSSVTDFATFYVLMPFPATDIWKILTENKLINIDDFYKETGYYLSTRGVNSTYFNNKEIRGFSTKAHKDVLKAQIKRVIFHPGHYLMKVRSFPDILYLFKLMKQFIYLILNSLSSGEKVGGVVYRKSVTRE